MGYDLEINDPGFIADPYPALKRLREHDPVFWSDTLRAWVLTGYDDVRAMLRDARLSSDRVRPSLGEYQGGERARIQELGRNLGLWAVFTDPPDHTRLRALMSTAFNVRAVGDMRPRIEAIVDKLLDGASRHGSMDLIRDFAYPLPATVIGELLGVPRKDVPLLKKWSDQLAGFVLTTKINPEIYRTASDGLAEMGQYFQDLIEERRADPGDDMISHLIAARYKGKGMSGDELVANCVLLLFAGHETTTQLIGNGMLALLRHPDQLADLRARIGEPAAIGNAVEEMLRWDGPALASVRLAGAGFAFKGRRIEEGDRLFLFNGAANRDPAIFEDPESFNVRRSETGRHMGFGFGPHICLGAPLARLEAAVAFKAILSRFFDLSLDDPNPARFDSLLLRGLDSLKLSFAAARAA